MLFLQFSYCSSKKNVFGQGKTTVFLTLGVMTSHDPSSYPCYYPEDIAARDPVDRNNIAEDMRGPKPDIETNGGRRCRGQRDKTARARYLRLVPTKNRFGLYMFIYIYLSIYLSIYLTIYRSIYRSIDLSIYRSISIYLSSYRFKPTCILTGMHIEPWISHAFCGGKSPSWHLPGLGIAFCAKPKVRENWGGHQIFKRALYAAPKKIPKRFNLAVCLNLAIFQLF